ncbi:MAG: ABC transporter substrate-binding protein [Myxococcota bacterium]
MKRWVCVVSVALAFFACTREHADEKTGSVSASASARDSRVDRPIELFTWWAKVGESDALAALERVHQKRYPHDRILNASAELSGAARKTLRERMLRGEPPDAFQANVGSDLMRWVEVNGLDARESRLVPLDDVLPDTAEWRRVMPRMLLEKLSYDGKLYAVPSNVHRINMVFYNRRVFAQHGLTEPKTLEDLFAAGPKLRAAGVDLISVGSREPWTLTLFVFESLLVASQGIHFYRDYFEGHLQPDDVRVRDTLKLALKLLEFANKDQRELSWLEALDRVMRGRAGLTVMGDWTRVFFASQGLVEGKDYDEGPFPGSAADAFVYTSDTFPLPLSAKNEAGAKRLLSTLGSREGQQALNEAKRSLSPRSDVTPNDPTLRAEYELFKQSEGALALSGLVPARFAEDLGSALAEMVEQKDIEPVLHTLHSRYRLLK